MNILSLKKLHHLPNSNNLNKSNGISSVIQNRLLNSSIYAVSQVGKSSSQIHKVIWLMILSAAVLGCSHQVWCCLNLYLQYPVVVNLNVDQTSKMAFPAVTICNLNRMDSQFESCIHENGFVSCTPNNDSSESYFPTKVVGSPLVVSERQSFMSCRSKLSGLQPKSKEKYLRFLDKYSKVDVKTRYALGYNCTDILAKCSFKGGNCDWRDFYTFQSMEYGNCFTFNKDGHLEVNPSAYGNGLEIVININADHYLPISHTLGARIIVHDPADDPQPEERGINISPGYDVTLSLKKTQMIRLRSPYRDRCIDYKPGGPPNMESPSACMQVCMQEQYYERCGCLEPTLLKISNEKQCNISNTTEMCCLDAVLHELEKFGSPCDCPLPCVSPYYHEIISMAKWPSRYFFLKNYVESNLTSDVGDALKRHRKTYAKVNIYYATSEVLSYELTPKFQFSEMLSHLGGELGLWLGLSLVAVFEFVETVLCLVHYMVTSQKCEKI